jgi:hypothetical protein
MLWTESTDKLAEERSRNLIGRAGDTSHNPGPRRAGQDRHQGNAELEMMNDERGRERRSARPRRRTRRVTVGV